MQFRINPSVLRGFIRIPPSKSETMRALFFGAMGWGKTHIEDPLYSTDTLGMVKALRQFGAVIDVHPTYMEVEGLAGEIVPMDRQIDAGNSGLILRFLGALAGLTPSRTQLTGDDSIRYRRPVQPLINGLQQLGARATICKTGALDVRGLLTPGQARFLGEDSQPVSALLMATSFLHGPTELIIDNPGETPWIDLTLHWMRRLNLSVDAHHYTHYRIHGYGRYEGFHTRIPGDLSSMAFPLAAAVITRSALTLTQVDMEACQGDKKIVDILMQMGASIEIDASCLQLHLRRGGALQGLELNINAMIDALPILAVLGCYADSPMRLTHAAIARHKESDRIHAMRMELEKMGAQIEELPDGLVISPSQLVGAHLSAHGDHRVAMALSIAALGALGTTWIDGVECVAKTFPTFARDLASVGAAIQEHR